MPSAARAEARPSGDAAVEARPEAESRPLLPAARREASARPPPPLLLLLSVLEPPWADIDAEMPELEEGVAEEVEAEVDIIVGTGGFLSSLELAPEEEPVARWDETVEDDRACCNCC